MTGMTNRRYTVVEQAGYEGENDRLSFDTTAEAYRWRDRNYTAAELEFNHRDCLHVEVRMDWTDAAGAEQQEYI